MAALFNEDWLIQSEEYSETMNGTVRPWLAEKRKEIAVIGAESRKIICDRYETEHAKGTVVVLHGFTECAEKFSEIIFSLLRNGYSVLAYDQRGHGRSWRDERIQDSSLTHVDRFSEYTEDLAAVCDQAMQEMPKPWYLLAHSMGGAVGILFLEDHPGFFEKAVLCSPMIAPQRGGMPLFMGKAMCLWAKFTGKSMNRIPMSQPWNGPENFETACATGKERFEWYDTLRTETEIYHNNGPTFSWTLEAFRVAEKILAPGKPEQVQIPVLIYTAEDDNQVLPEAQEKLARRLPCGKRRLVAGAKHEIYRSRDMVLFPWWKEILSFYETNE